MIKAKYTLPWFGETLYVGLGSVAAVILTGVLVWAWCLYVRPNPKTPPQRG